jgi:phosphohistidine phosphatase SixA
MRLKLILKIFSVFSVAVLFFSWGVYTVKEKVFPYGLLVKARNLLAKPEQSNREQAVYWANRISQGGYILHFRHAEREKWNDVTAFDAYELLTKASAEKTSWSRATCLTPRGIEESKLIGNIFKITGVKTNSVISSPSCRAIQTAQSAFGRVDKVENSLLHRTAIMTEQWPKFSKELQSLLRGLTPVAGSNIVLIGHGETLKHELGLFEAGSIGAIDERDETGFVVIENLDGKLYARHKFKSFRDYVHATVQLP